MKNQSEVITAHNKSIYASRADTAHFGSMFAIQLLYQDGTRCRYEYLIEL